MVTSRQVANPIFTRTRRESAALHELAQVAGECWTALPANQTAVSTKQDG